MVFGREGDPKYKEARDVVNVFIEVNRLGRSINCVYHDMNTVEGLTEGHLRNVRDYPAILVIGRNKKVVDRWDGDVPSREDLVSTVLLYS